MQIETLDIRLAAVDDLPVLERMALDLGKAKDPQYFSLQYEAQEAGVREIVLGVYEGQLIAYAILNWQPKYAFYLHHEIPEIQDLNVLSDFRQRGVASAMIAHCEARAIEKGRTQMGISFGLTRDYGPAQRLYVRLGYKPDGEGVTYDRKPVVSGDFKPVDDDLCLMLVKDLQS